MNPRVVVRVNAVVILTLGVALTVPLALSWLYGDGSWASFLSPGGAMILKQDGYTLVTTINGRGNQESEPFEIKGQASRLVFEANNPGET